MAGLFITFFQLLVQVLYFALLGRVILSWIDPMGQWRISQVLYEITEPILAPIRRVMPNMGMLDLSPLVAFILLEVLRQAFGRVLVP